MSEVLIYKERDEIKLSMKICAMKNFYAKRYKITKKNERQSDVNGQMKLCKKQRIFRLRTSVIYCSEKGGYCKLKGI